MTPLLCPLSRLHGVMFVCVCECTRAYPLILHHSPSPFPLPDSGASCLYVTSPHLPEWRLHIALTQEWARLPFTPHLILGQTPFQKGKKKGFWCVCVRVIPFKPLCLSVTPLLSLRFLGYPSTIGTAAWRRAMSINLHTQAVLMFIYCFVGF